MNYTIYNPKTGEIIATPMIGDPTLVQLNLGDSTYIEGNYLSNQYYIDIATKQPIAIPIKPFAGLNKYTFDWPTKTWIINQSETEFAVRAQRNSLLNQTVDQVNPVWYASLTQEQQQELSTYRQVLLDVPSPSGFPTDVSWPTKPTWM